MALRITAVATLVSWYSVETWADTNITLISFPVNITSWKLSLQDALSHPLEGIRGKLKEYVEFTKNGSITCIEEGGECTTQRSSCCPGSEDDLECLPVADSDVYLCGRLKSSEELAQQRIDNLQYGDSKGIANSHPWVDSWEFQSRSEMEREEEQVADDMLWKKNVKPNNVDNIWAKIYTKIKSGGEDLWHDLRKLKKLREIKNSLIDRYRKRDKNNECCSHCEEVTDSKRSAEHPAETTHRIPKIAGEEEPISDNAWLYPSDTSGSTKKETNSEESLIKFSDEMPRREKKIDFRIDDIIKDATKYVNKKLKEKTAVKTPSKELQESNTSPALQEPLYLNDILESADKLKKEINELKMLKEQKSKHRKDLKVDEPTFDELIRKQVALILDEERKLDKLKKIQELSRIEQSSKQ